MTKKFLLFICALIIAGTSFGQLTGIKNIPGGGATGYATLAAAIADLNLQGVGPGGITFNIVAGHTETFASPTAGLITATGTAANPIIFQKSGTGGDPVITAGIGTTTNVDGIIVIAGGDYFTFDGIDLMDSPTNTTPTTRMEWGFAMVKARNTFPVDGCQYITIRNCGISLNPSHTATSGIYSGNHISTTTSPAANGTLYTVSDYSSNCKFYNNTISNVFRGFNLNGFNDNLALIPASFDQNNEIGIEGAGNIIIQNVSSSTICYGIYANFQTNLKIVYNTISGYNARGAMYGITPRTSNSADIHHNTISISSAGTSGSTAIDLYGAGSPGFTTEVHDNLIQNCNMTGAGGFNGIYGGTAAPDNMNIYSNTLTGITVTTGGISMISLGGGGGTYNNIYNNLIYNNTKTGPGSFYCITNINYMNCNTHDNQIYSNNIVTSGIVSTGSTLIGINSSQNGQTSEAIYNNLIYDLNITGTTTSVSNAIYGISTDILEAASRNWYNNIIRNLSISTPAGSGTVIGMRVNNGSTSNIFKNQVFNLQVLDAAGVVNGCQIASGADVNVYNNFFSDLQTPSSVNLNAVNGILISGGTKVGVYYNTVFLNSSSSASTFGTSGIYKTGATTLADLRNNVILNTSIPGTSGGLTVAYRWSGVYNPAYYAVSSNANNFYAGVPGSNRLMFYDGTNADQTLADYQARVSPNDALSFSEKSPLVNATTTPYDLHMNTSIATLCQNGGVPVTSPAINDDIDGNPRSTTPDVGADEFAGISIGVINPTGFSPAVASSRQINLPFLLNPAGNNVVIVWNTTGYFTTPSGTPPAVNSAFAGGTLLYNGTTSPVGHTGLTGGTTYFYKAFSNIGSNYSSGVPASAITNVDQPGSFGAYGVSTSQIDLSWTKNPLANDVIIAVNSANNFGQPVNGTTYTAGTALPTAGTVLYVGPLTGFSHSGLTSNTKYYYKAWSVDAYKWYSNTGISNNTTTLLCEPTATLPFLENFDTYTPPAIGCGSVIDGNSDGIVWGSFTVSASTAHSGTKVLSLAYSPVKTDDWYFIRGLNLVAGQKYLLSFYYRAQYTSPSSSFEVKWGTSPTPEGMFNPALFTIVTPSNFNPYPLASCYITAPSTGIYYFGWHATDNYTSYSNIYIDDISISTSNCASPLTVTADAVTTNSADIGWTGDAPNVQIDYGTVGHVAGAGTLISTSSNPCTLTGLNPLTSYDVYVRKDCGLASYSFWTGPATFTTAYQPPVVITGAASALTGPGATLNATVNAGGISTRVYFEYGLTTDYGLKASVTAAVTGTATNTVSVNLTGLIPGGALYHYRAVGYNNGNFTYGNDLTFITPDAAPTVNTTPATLITSTGATLNGTVNANNATATVTFEYGTTIAYGSTVTATVSPVNGLFDNAVSAPISGLIPGTVYNFRVNATNPTGTSNGINQTFIAVDLPTVTTTSATWDYASTTSGILKMNGIVNANSSNTTVTFQYGLTEDYGSVANGVPPTVTGNAPTNVTTANITLSGTNLNRVYHYRIVAVNSTGTSYGSDMTIATVKTPTVTTTAATFPATGITLNSSTGANNANTTLIYEYGLTSAFGSTIAYPSNPITGTSASGRVTIVTGLLPGTLYYFRPVATNIAGTTTGATMTFTTPVPPTSATTLAATLITSTGGRLNGTVVTTASSAIPTNLRFEIGLSPTTMTTTGLSPTPGIAQSNGTFSPAITLTGLLQNTTYYYRVYAFNASGTVYGAIMTFTTLASAPTVNTIAAYGITPAGAVVNGTVNANNQTTEVTFEYGLTTTYGSTVTATQSPITGNTTIGVTAPLNGLQSNTLYNYRVVGVNAGGTSSGSNLTFTTLPILPEVATGAASSITSVGATLHGTVNANNASTIARFEYGLTTAYGSSVTLPSPVEGGTVTAVSALLSGLSIGTTYHFRCVGTNGGGTTYGTDQQFTTRCEPVVTIFGETNICSNAATNVLYFTESGMNSYNWIVSPGGTILMGEGTSFIIVTWNTPGPQTVSVNYINSFGCTAAGPTIMNVMVYEPFAIGSIAADQTIAYNTVPDPLTGSAPTGGMGPYFYQWQVSPDGINFSDIYGAIDLNYSPGALTSTTYYRQVQISRANCGAELTNIVTITVGPPIPLITTVQDVTISSGQSNCYNAFQTIYVAGGGTVFVVQNGGSATMIAGQSIFFYPGTTVQEGGYLHGYIAPEGPWCTTPSNPIVNNPAVAGDVQTALSETAANQSIKVYPNPTNGSFTIELNGIKDDGISRVEIIGMNGIKSQSVELNGERKSTIGTENLKPGIYFIQVTTGNGKETLKLIKM